MTQIVGVTWAAAVAHELGDGWYASLAGWKDDPELYAARLTGPDGISLFVDISSCRYGTGRAEIRWDIHESLSKHARRPDDARRSITVAADKPAQRIAGDITRRLLPGLAELLVQLAEAKQVSDDRASAEAAFLDKMAGILGGRVTDYRGHSSPEVVFGERHAADGGTVKTRADDSAEITLHVSRDMAVLIALAVAEIRK